MLTLPRPEFAVAAVGAFVAGSAALAVAIVTITSDTPVKTPGVVQTVVLFAGGVVLLCIALVLVAGCVAGIVIADAQRNRDAQLHDDEPLSGEQSATGSTELLLHP
jgi:hypothetical protein